MDRRVLVMSSLMMVSACSHADDGPWTLRDNVTPIYEGSTIEASVVVNDVDIDGQRVVVLRMDSGFAYAHLHISDDFGRTWRHVQVFRNILTELGGDSYSVGVHLVHGQIFLMLSADFDGVYSRWRVYAIDEVSGDPTEVDLPVAQTGLFPVHHADGHLRWLVATGEPFIGDLDPSTGDISVGPVPCSGQACYVTSVATRDGGDSFDAYTNTYATSPQCMLHHDVASGTSTEACVQRGAWPGTDSSLAQPVQYRGATPYVAWQAAGQSYATAVLPTTPASVSETLRLGPGTATLKAGNMNRVRFGDFIFLEQALDPVTQQAVPAKLAHLSAAGAELASFPLTPCTADHDCGYEGFPDYHLGEIQWIQPTGQGDYFVFYTLEAGTEHPAQTLYVERETPVFAPIDGAVAPPITALEIPDGAQPMGPLAQACAVYATCAGFYDSYRYCLERYASTRGERPGIAAARARFIAGGTSCEAMRAAYPEGFTPPADGCPLGCLESGGTCSAMACTTEVPYLDSQCLTCDGDGNYLTCPGGSHAYAVSCASYGLVCSAGYGCVLPGDDSACGPYETACDGATLRACDARSNVLTETDCTLTGSTCDASMRACVHSGTAASCDPTSYGFQCDATHKALLACTAGEIQYLACSELGLSTCVDASTPGHCQ